MGVVGGCVRCLQRVRCEQRALRMVRQERRVVRAVSSSIGSGNAAWFRSECPEGMWGESTRYLSAPLPPGSRRVQTRLQLSALSGIGTQTLSLGGKASTASIEINIMVAELKVGLASVVAQEVRSFLLRVGV